MKITNELLNEWFIGNLPTNCLNVFDHFVGFSGVVFRGCKMRILAKSRLSKKIKSKSKKNIKIFFFSAALAACKSEVSLICSVVISKTMCTTIPTLTQLFRVPTPRTQSRFGSMHYSGCYLCFWGHVFKFLSTVDFVAPIST